MSYNVSQILSFSSSQVPVHCRTSNQCCVGVCSRQMRGKRKRDSRQAVGDINKNSMRGETERDLMGMWPGKTRSSNGAEIRSKQQEEGRRPIKGLKKSSRLGKTEWIKRLPQSGAGAVCIGNHRKTWQNQIFKVSDYVMCSRATRTWIKKIMERSNNSRDEQMRCLRRNRRRTLHFFFLPVTMELEAIDGVITGLPWALFLVVISSPTLMPPSCLVSLYVSNPGGR